VCVGQLFFDQRTCNQKKKFYEIVDSTPTLLNGFVNKFKFYSDKLIPSSISDDRLLVSTGLPTFLQGPMLKNFLSP
jgi:hypothetical protein